MSHDQVDARVTRMAGDPAFAAARGAAPTRQDAQRIAAEHGFDVAFAELPGVAAERELDDADLDMVVGGPG